VTTQGFSRRNLLKSLSVGAAAGSVLLAIPMEAAEHVHHMIETEKAMGPYAPKYFTEAQYKLLTLLCGTILPADADSAGAVEAGAPEFIDLLTSENTEYQRQLGGGLLWLEGQCLSRYGNGYLDCTQQQQKEMLDRIAYRKNAEQDKDLGHGVEFFTLLRNLTSDGFFTSKIGIEYLGYVGNTFLLDFPGCPPVPGL
jgi:gluconate 2-dehydrogenase gamma chain